MKVRKWKGLWGALAIAFPALAVVVAQSPASVFAEEEVEVAEGRITELSPERGDGPAVVVEEGEEATAAAANLRAESQELTRLIGRFQTGAAAARHSRPELVASTSHRPAPNPVARQHAKLAAAVGAEAEWSEF